MLENNKSALTSSKVNTQNDKTKVTVLNTKDEFQKLQDEIKKEEQKRQKEESQKNIYKVICEYVATQEKLEDKTAQNFLNIEEAKYAKILVERFVNDRKASGTERFKTFGDYVAKIKAAQELVDKNPVNKVKAQLQNTKMSSEDIASIEKMIAELKANNI